MLALDAAGLDEETEEEPPISLPVPAEGVDAFGVEGACVLVSVLSVLLEDIGEARPERIPGGVFIVDLQSCD